MNCGLEPFQKEILKWRKEAKEAGDLESRVFYREQRIVELADHILLKTDLNEKKIEVTTERIEHLINPDFFTSCSKSALRSILKDILDKVLR